MGLRATAASVTLDLGSGAALLLAQMVAAIRILVFLGCPCLDLREHLELLPEIPDLGLGVLDLGRVQVVEGIEKTAKVVM